MDVYVSSSRLCPRPVPPTGGEQAGAAGVEKPRADRVAGHPLDKSALGRKTLPGMVRTLVVLGGRSLRPLSYLGGILYFTVPTSCGTSTCITDPCWCGGRVPFTAMARGQSMLD